LPRTDGGPDGVCADSRDISVWVVSYLFAPVWAGPAERFLRYGPKLAERGVSMAIVTAMRPGQPRHETKDGIAIERIGHANTRATSVDAFLARAVLRALATRPRPHVMVFLTPGRVLPPFLLLLRMKGIKSMYVSTMARLDPGPAEAIRKRLLNGLKRAAYDGFDSLVCSTRALVDDLTVLGLGAAKIEVIPNGVSLSRFRPAKDIDEVRRARQALDLPLDGPIVLYVGSRVDRKGVIELVEGWQRYRDEGGEGWLVMVGQELRHDPERAPFYERWDRCVATLRASHHVELRGPHPRIEEYFRAADVVVLLSELEGTPNVIPEAMASGVPVLTTRFRGFSTELGRDGRELVITERDPHAVSQALARLLGDARLRRALAAAGRAWVERHQDLEVSLDAYRALFERLTTTSKGSGGGAP
jgi:glycosyltransferase involved in cell wall biosynthesis